MTSNFNIKFMEEAYKMALEAFDEGEVPVGAVIVRNGEIVATGRNRREKSKNALLHAEIDAINNACNTLGGWRLWNCEIYITLEPCPMCAGAIINAHIPEVYFGAYDFKNGSCGTITNLFEMPYNFKPNCTGGIMEKECSELLKSFFKKLR
ncbi:MAG: nucleoside deaminase [Ruminococcus sp.]|nr:nucleoside deaminase [Ruminococcus sp.]